MVSDYRRGIRGTYLQTGACVYDIRAHDVAALELERDDSALDRGRVWMPGKRVVDGEGLDLTQNRSPGCARCVVHCAGVGEQVSITSCTLPRQFSSVGARGGD